MAATFCKATPIPEILFVAFQATFAAITVCLILGAFAERIKFSAVLLFAVLWFTFAYVPIAHMVWFWTGPDAYTDAKLVDAPNAKAGLIWQWGALDFAGGTVVHINAGVAGLVGAYVLGKRIGYGKEAMAPHNLPMTMIGASLLWVGWFGFNAGSALEAGNSAVARVHQHVPRDGVRRARVDVRRVDDQGQAVDARRGVGCGGRSRRDHAGRRQRRHPGRVRDRHRGGLRLPVGRQRPEAHAGGRRHARRVRRARGRRHPRRAAHRRVRRPALGGPGFVSDWVTGEIGLHERSPSRCWIQAKAVGLTIVWSGVVAFIVVQDRRPGVGLRVPEEEEREGLDIASHGESAYRI